MGLMNRSTYPSKVLQPETLIVEGSFQPNGTGAVNNASNEGVGFSVARAGVGIFEVTFSQKFTALINFDATVRLNSPANTFVQGGVYTPATASAKGKIAIVSLTAGAAADIAFSGNSWIGFRAKFRNTHVKPHRGV